MGQRAALYCRVSTADQSCMRQERNLAAFVARAGYEVVGIYKETGSGAKADRTERRRVLALAQRREIDAVLVDRSRRFVPSWPAPLTTQLRHSLLWSAEAGVPARHGRASSQPCSGASSR